jgi:serine O-acetyltransferase
MYESRRWKAVVKTLPGFVLIHSIGVVINGSVRGGRRVHIEHQVMIGAEKRQSPVVGDDV